ncbi:MAG TPA: hypothetical protein VMZ69_06490, partial [Saprospiraceae bacterium]|nr:hypothetical protein [Saprospiraceae bacterium]
MKQFTILISIIFGLAGLLVAQKQNDFWFFGSKAGLDFNTIPPTPLESTLFTFEGTASVSDKNGNLLFYSNGAQVWDRGHNVMPNGSGLTGGISSTQAALIVRLPNSSNRYFLFTTEDQATDGGLSYSIVDINLNGGLGDIVNSTKNTLVVNQTAEKITAVLHSNGLDVWIITHLLNSNEFLSYLLTSTGLNTNPVISAIGSFYPANAHIGPVKASHRGLKIASSATEHNIAELFDFDPSTGQLSNLYDLNQLINKPDSVYGIEFSPNDSILYLSTHSKHGSLYQYNLATGQFRTMSIAPYQFAYGALQLGSDGKIYLARYFSKFLDIIHEPNNYGLVSQYESQGIDLLPETQSYLGLPNFPPYSFLPNVNSLLSLGQDVTVCFGESFLLNVDFPMNCEAISYLWSDGSTGNHLEVNQPGLYWVKIESSCLNFSDSIQIDFAPCPLKCGNSIGYIYGTPDGNERGYCLASTTENDAFYVAGIKNDSTRIMKVDLAGTVLWSRTFDIVPGKKENVNSILLDSEGMLGVSGTVGEFPIGSSVFAFRYNPNNNSILWDKEYVNNWPGNNFSIIQKGTGGNYIIIDKGYANIEFALLLELNLNTGNIQSNLSNRYYLPGGADLTDLIFYNDFLYGAGRGFDGGTLADIRHALIKLDAAGGGPVWARLGHRSSNLPARLSGKDIVIDQSKIYSAYSGDPTGTSVLSSKLYIQKTDLDGNLIWLNQYELPGSNDEAFEMIKSGAGFVILAGNNSTPRDIVLFKINTDGEVLWSKKFQFAESIVQIGILESRSAQIIEVANKLVFTAYAFNDNGGTNMLLVMTDLNGEFT